MDRGAAQQPQTTQVSVPESARRSESAASGLEYQRVFTREGVDPFEERAAAEEGQAVERLAIQPVLDGAHRAQQLAGQPAEGLSGLRTDRVEAVAEDALLALRALGVG